VKDGGSTVDSGTRSGVSTISIRNSSHATADLAEYLARSTGRVVIDKTSLQGNFTFTLKFSSDDTASDPNAVTSDASVSVFTALKEQLGLELKPGRGPVDVLVIDHIEQPTAN
jgi:uncharacterized protein (TIGR03435 family)